MLARLHAAVLHGIDALPCEVEADLAERAETLPRPTIVGLPDTAVKESLDRIRSALFNSGYGFPEGRLTIAAAAKHNVIVPGLPGAGVPVVKPARMTTVLPVLVAILVLLFALPVTGQTLASQPATQTAQPAAPTVSLLSVLSGIKEVVLTGAAVAGLIYGYLGLKTWRRQLEFNILFQQARPLLRAAFRMRNALGMVRHSYMPPEEIFTALRAKGVEDSQMQHIIMRGGPQVDNAVYGERWKSVQQAMSDFYTEVLDAEVLWGPKAREVTKPIIACAQELQTNLQQYLRATANADRPYDAELEHIERVIWSDAPGTDAFQKEIDEAVAKVEAFTRPHLALQSEEKRKLWEAFQRQSH